MTDGKDTTTHTASGAEAGPDPGREDCTARAASAPTAPSEAIGGPHLKFHSIQFRVHVSMRYHQARRAWWGNLNRISSALAALAGSAALIAVFGDAHKSIWAWVSAISGSLAALNSALAFAERSREHADLYRSFSGIASRMAASSSTDEAAGRTFEAEVLQLEASEPPTIHSLNVICHNQECEAQGLPQQYKCRVYWINRVFAQVGTVYDRFPQLPASTNRGPG
jgi:hypothetical protein